MLRWTAVLPLSGVLAALLLHSPAEAQRADPELPVSLDRIRAALSAPPPVLRAAEPAGDLPTFRVEISQYLPIQPLVDDPPFDPTYGLPSVGELVVGGIGKIRSAAIDYKHRRAKRRARKEVGDALAEFCAVHACPAPERTPPR